MAAVLAAVRQRVERARPAPSAPGSPDLAVHLERVRGEPHVDGDDFDEIVNDGALFFGNASLPVWYDVEDLYFDRSGTAQDATVAGDLDGDGHNDWVLGTSTSTYVVLGGPDTPTGWIPLTEPRLWTPAPARTPSRRVTSTATATTS